MWLVPAMTLSLTFLACLSSSVEAPDTNAWTTPRPEEHRQEPSFLTILNKKQATKGRFRRNLVYSFLCESIGKVQARNQEALGLSGIP